MSFVAKSGYTVSPVFDIRAVVQGVPAFFIIKVKESLKEAFLRAVASPASMNLTQFGEVLHYGAGEPDAELKELLHRKYGMYQ